MPNQKKLSVRNILVSKDKISDFLEFYRKNLKKCPFCRKPFVSGPYMIFTLSNVKPEDRKLIAKHESEWM